MVTVFLRKFEEMSPLDVLIVRLFLGQNVSKISKDGDFVLNSTTYIILPMTYGPYDMEDQHFWSVTVKMSKFTRSGNEENNASLYLCQLEVGYQSVVCIVE